MGPPRAWASRPLLLHAAFLALVLCSLWLLATQEPDATRHFRTRAVPQHLVHARSPRDDDDVAPRLSREVLALLRMGDRVVREELAEAYAEDVFSVDWTQFVARRDVLHLGALQRACMANADSIISHAVGRHQNGETRDSGLINRTVETEQDREALLESLRLCPDVDVFLPRERRSLEHCEDAAAYAKYLHARILPRWVLEITLFDKTRGRDVSYHELCPYTPMIFLDTNWEGVRDSPAWPTTKPVYLLATAATQAPDKRRFRQADMILCKTAACASRVTSWFERVGNPRMTRVLYHRFTSSDAVTNVLVANGVESYDANWQHTTPKERETTKFVHFAGDSLGHDNSPVLNCWLSRTYLPQLDLYVSEDRYSRFFKRRYGELLRESSNVKIHTERFDTIRLGEILAQTGFFLSVNYSEGNGHFLNHARAAGAVILTSDAAPMSELVTPTSGILYSFDPESEHSLGLKDVPGLSALLASDKLCMSVDEVLKKLKPSDRQERVHRARQQFFYDSAFFALKMRQLLDVLRPSIPSDIYEDPK